MFRTLSLVIIISFSSGIFGENNTAYAVSEIYTDLRNQVLNIPKKQNLIENFKDSHPLAILMETGIERGSYSLVAIADGSASLYFSNGGGIIGAGEYPEVRKIVIDFLKLSKNYSDLLQKTSNYPLPKRDRTRFYIVGINSVVSAEFKEDDLGNERLPLSPLFLKGHELISAIQFVDKKRAEEGQ